MLLENIKIGFAITGSFCTFASIPLTIKELIEEGADIYPIFSTSTDKFDTRFGSAVDFRNKITVITGKEPIDNIMKAEPIGPEGLLDVLVIAPCTGNTLGKIANAITDTPVTMAYKAHLRNNRPVIISISTNDGLSANAKNIGTVLNTKNVYMVPFGQDAPLDKPTSLIADNGYLVETILCAMDGEQLQPILL